jgi:nucleotide-binding universal stress UspA family protein
MLRLRGLAIVILLTASSLLTLKLMGLSQWIQAILIIAVELSLGVVLHEMLEGRDRREHARRPTHHRKPPRPLLHVTAHVHPHRHGARAGSEDKDASVEAYQPRCRLLLPVRDDRPGLVEYAIRECRSHRAELDLLFLRVPGHGAIGTKTEEDKEALAVIEHARRRAERAGVPFQAFYAVTCDIPRTIVTEANARQADLVIMAAPGRERIRIWPGRPARDDIRAVLDALPEDVGLLVHA